MPYEEVYYQRLDEENSEECEKISSANRENSSQKPLKMSNLIQEVTSYN